ncbi:enoyl-CoA hydratase [Sphingopyxis yananensis]|uniref:enoyl-CoA hydratase n=1 Tax=Sphingopyxis yananensis TaxID=2886687 RepID=UPI001D11550E|nr:enoyl-CoA hydratase [Sphingopyxis yananensis]MCC2602840.1 enoyl-CoA hydratase [Sphingopyxis yananensis]
MTLVLVEKQDGVATVTLNRPEAMNALSRALRDEFCQTMDELAADVDVRAIVVTGAGTRAFTAGLDLKELGSDSSQLSAANAATKSDNPAKAIEACPQPVIGAINGVAITGGFEVALACDFLIASPNARFADTHGRVGILPGWGLSARLSRIIGIGRAKQLSLTGNFLDAETACDWGLVSEVVPADQLVARAQQLARDAASIDPAMAQDYKKLINDGYGMSLNEAMEYERRISAARNSAVSAEDVEQRRRAVMERGREQKS